MFMKKVKIASALALALAASTASATDFDLKVGVLDQNTELGSVEGFVVGAAVEATEGLTVHADYKDLKDDSLIEAGIRYEVGVTDKVDFVGGISYLQFDGADETDLADPLNPIVDDMEDNALSLQAGVRALVADAVTFEFGMERIDWDERDMQDFAPYLSASVDVTDTVAVSFQHREALNESAVVVSWSF